MATLGLTGINSNATSTPPVIADSFGTQIGTFCRAWVNFNGTNAFVPNPSTSAIRASFNVSSISRYATGEYGVNFSTALADANFAIAGTVEGDAASNGTSLVSLPFGYTPSASSARFWTASSDTVGLFDKTYISVAIFR
jgi:hypothetical protein